MGLGGRLCRAGGDPDQLTALLLELRIEGLEVVHARQRHQIVTAREAHQALDLPLLVGTANQAEVRFEQEVALELQEGVGQFTLAFTDDLGYGDLAVVVADAFGDGAEEVEGIGGGHP